MAPKAKHATLHMTETSITTSVSTSRHRSRVHSRDLHILQDIEKDFSSKTRRDKATRRRKKVHKWKSQSQLQLQSRGCRHGNRVIARTNVQNIIETSVQTSRKTLCGRDQPRGLDFHHHPGVPKNHCKAGFDEEKHSRRQGNKKTKKSSQMKTKILAPSTEGVHKVSTGQQGQRLDQCPEQR